MPPAPEPLTQPLPIAFDWDVVVVGAGLAGALAAHGLARRGVRVVLVEQRNLDAAARGNARLLSEWAPSATVFRLPWVDGTEGVKQDRRMTAALKSLADALGKR